MHADCRVRPVRFVRCSSVRWELSCGCLFRHVAGRRGHRKCCGAVAFGASEGRVGLRGRCNLRHRPESVRGRGCRVCPVRFVRCSSVRWELSCGCLFRHVAGRRGHRKCCGAVAFGASEGRVGLRGRCNLRHRPESVRGRGCRVCPVRFVRCSSVRWNLSCGCPFSIHVAGRRGHRKCCDAVAFGSCTERSFLLRLVYA